MSNTKTLEEIAALPVAFDTVIALVDWMQGKTFHELRRDSAYWSLIEGPLGRYVLTMPQADADALDAYLRRIKNE